MANHVNSYLSFRSINEEAVKVLEDLYKLWSERDTDDSWSVHLGYTWFEDLDGVTRDQMCNLAGAKWAYASDFDSSGICFESAWSPVSEFVEWLIQKLAKVDENIVAVYTYEDEMPNFIGVRLYTEGGEIDGVELDSGEIETEIMEQHDHLKELFDEDEEWWTDDGEAYREVLYDWINDWQDKECQSMLECAELGHLSH